VTTQEPEYIEPEGSQDQDPTIRPNDDKHPNDDEPED